MSELSDDARALLRDMRRDDLPDDARRARVRAALAAQLASPASPSPAVKAATAKASLASVAVKLAIVATLVTGLAFSVRALHREAPRHRAPEPPVVAIRAPSSRAPEAPSVIAPPITARHVTAPPVAAPPVVALSSRRMSPRHAANARHEAPAVVVEAVAPVVEPSPPTPPPQRRSIAAELELLQRSQLALDNHRTAEALRLLDAYAAEHADGVLRQEAAAQRVLALCARGRIPEARALGDAVLRDAPGSPAATRVRGSCAARRPLTPDE